MRRWSARWSRRWRAWSGAAWRSTATCCRACRANSRKAWRGSRTKIDAIVGAPFNLGSPKQLGDILFGQMGLPGGKKTATGAWSTSASVLDDLAAEGHAAAGAHSRMAPARQAQVDLHRRAARLRQSRDRPRAHVLRARRDDDRAPVVVRAQPAEHPGAHRGGPQDPPRLRRAGGPQADLGRLQPDRIAPARPYRRHPGAEEGLRRRARHPRDDRLGNVRRADQGHAGRRCAGAPRRSISASSTASRRSASPTSSASRARRRAPTSANISSASPASATIWRRPRRRRAPTATYAPFFGRKCHYPAHQRVEPFGARVQRARRDQRAAPGLGGRHHPPRDDAHGRGARAREA